MPAKVADRESAKVPCACPSGHELQLWKARAGKCDGCSRVVRDGMQVMDCRRCNWYLCKSCCPPKKAPDPTLWGTVHALPFYALDIAAQEVKQLTVDLGLATLLKVGVPTESGSPAKDALAEQKRHRQRLELRKTATEFQMLASELVHSYCHGFDEQNAAPDEEELCQLWSTYGRCYVGDTPAGPLARSICAQVQLAAEAVQKDDGQNTWQAPLRLLHLVIFLQKQGGSGKEVSDEVIAKVSGLLRKLAELPQCQNQAFDFEAVKAEKQLQNDSQIDVVGGPGQFVGIARLGAA